MAATSRAGPDLPAPTPVTERAGPLPRGAEWEALVAEDRPVVFRGAAQDWPLVQAGLRSAKDAADLLLAKHGGGPLVVYRGPPDIAGRFFYNAAMDGFNFTASREALGPLLDELLSASDAAASPSLYVGSTDLEEFFPQLAAENSLQLAQIHPSLAGPDVVGSVWLGNRTTAICHYDYSHNIAVCAVGRRRFTLFPPDQAANLYPGPLDPTPGGQVVSMVDITDPDLERFPRFRGAASRAQVVELSPADVLVYPAMWWHEVEALEPFNVLVNYWWNAVGAHIDSPQVTLLHALLSLRDRGDSEKQAWQALFDYYIFGDPDQPRAHLPDAIQGPLAPMDDMLARRLRSMVARKLNR